MSWICEGVTANNKVRWSRPFTSDIMYKVTYECILQKRNPDKYIIEYKRQSVIHQIIATFSTMFTDVKTAI